MKYLVRIADISTEKEGHIIEVGLMYSLGGMSYFSGTVKPRGYFLYARPAEVANGGRTIAMFHGFKDKVADANRDVIVGIKVRVGRHASGDQGTAPLDIALQVAEESGMPLMAHVDEPAPT